MGLACHKRKIMSVEISRETLEFFSLQNITRVIVTRVIKLAKSYDTNDINLQGSTFH